MKKVDKKTLKSGVAKKIKVGESEMTSKPSKGKMKSASKDCKIKKMK